MGSSQLDDRHFRAVFDSAVDGIFIGSPDGKIFFANAAGCRIFGGTEEELRAAGRSGISEEDDEGWRQLLARREQAGTAVGVVPMHRLDGFPLLAEVSTSAFDGPDGERRTCVIVRDVTDRVRMERRLVAYDEITEALLGGVETVDVLEMLAHHACILFDADLAAVMVPNEGVPGVKITAAHGHGAEALRGSTFPPGGRVEAVMSSAEPRLIEDVSVDARHPGIRDLGMGPAMMAPIGASDGVLGALLVAAQPSRHPFQKADLEEVTRYAARAGVIITVGHARAEAETDLRRTSEQLQQALYSRVAIEQAKGFVACLRHVGSDEAFRILRRYARSHNMGIHDVARLVLERRLVV